MLREKCDFDSKTIRRLKANENMEPKTLDQLRTAPECRLEDIAEFPPPPRLHLPVSML